MKENFWTIPNIISLCRLLIAPYIGWLIVEGNEKLYIILLTLSLLSDIADGYIARKFKMETEIGAKLDAFADLLVYILAIWGIIEFKWNDISKPQYAIIFFVFLSLYFLPKIVSLIKFKETPSLHMISSKVVGYIHGAFIITLFWFGFNAFSYYFAMTAGILTCIEQLIIVILLPEPRVNVKGLYWLLKDKKNAQS